LFRYFFGSPFQPKELSISVLQPITPYEQAKRGWQLKINGVVIEVVTSFSLSHPDYGTLEYGATPQGYDSWCFSEVGGGASVIVPYTIFDARLLIGLVRQPRYTMGGEVWNLPRGFLASNETHFEAALREAREELNFNLAHRFNELPGSPANPNSTFFVTSGAGEGVRFYGLEIKEAELDKRRTPEGQTVQIRPDVPMLGTKVGELITPY